MANKKYIKWVRLQETHEYAKVLLPIKLMRIQKGYVCFEQFLFQEKASAGKLVNSLPLPRPSPQAASTLSDRLLCTWGRGWRSCSPPAGRGGCRPWWTWALSIHREQSGVQIHPLCETDSGSLLHTTPLKQWQGRKHFHMAINTIVQVQEIQHSVVMWFVCFSFGSEPVWSSGH